VKTAVDEPLAKMRLYYVSGISVIRLEFDGLVMASARGLLTAHSQQSQCVNSYLKT
jgi:hypothetical protein